MGDLADISADTGGTDVTGGSSPSTATEDVSTDTSSTSDIFGDQNYDKEFGLQPEEKQADVSPDVPAATDPPVPHQDTEVKREGEEAPVEKPEGETTQAPKDDKTDAAAPDKDGQFTENEKLNWEDDKVPFRQEFKNLKDAYVNLLENSPEAMFVTEPAKFVDWMKETAPTSFNEVGKALAQESATAHPKEWIDFLAKTNPDLVAEVISGREGMTAERLKAELDVLLDEDDEDVQDALEKRKAEAAKNEKPEETPEQKEIREWREERAREKQATVVKEIFQPVYQAVDSLVSDAGLEINEKDIAGKKFEDLDPDTQFKAMVNDLMPLWIDHRVKQNPQMVAMQDRLQQFLDAGDVQGAKKLQHAMTIAATNFTGELLSLVTGQVAKSKQSKTKIPADNPPTPMVKSAGAASGFSDADLAKPLTDEDWNGSM